MNKIITTGLVAVMALGMLVATLSAETKLSLSAKGEKGKVGVAVFDFETKDKSLIDLGDKIADMISAKLTTDPLLQVVEREKLDRILNEMKLGISGIVSEEEAVRIGHLTGAKVLVTGRAFPLDNELVIVVKVIGTEKSRVFAEIAKGPLSGKLETIVDELAVKVNNRIIASTDELLAKPEIKEDPVVALSNKIKGKKLPTIAVIINETNRGTPTVDPASETEILYFLKQCNFDIADARNIGLSSWAKEYFEDAKINLPQTATVDVVIVGEAFSEFGTRIGDLVSCKGRLEVKAIDRKTNKILAIDRKVKTAVDLSEGIAGKKALQEAAEELSLRFIPEVVDSWNKAHKE